MQAKRDRPVKAERARSRIPASWFFVAGAALLGGAAHAQYRCVQPGGGVSYQQTPCAADAKAKKLELSATATSTPGGREDRTDWAAVIRDRPQPVKGEEATARGCPTPQQIKHLEFEASKIANRKHADMQARLARARACQ
jgi:hypothetical protein